MALRPLCINACSGDTRELATGIVGCSGEGEEDPERAGEGLLDAALSSVVGGVEGVSPGD